MRTAAALAAVVALVTAAAAAAVSGYPWTLVASGTTTPSGGQQPSAFLVTTKAQEARWLPRLTPTDRRAVSRVPLARYVVVAAFLDGAPCAQKVDVTTVFRSGASLVVRIKYTPPPVGVATCVRTSTAYDVIEVARKALGSRLPSRVSLDLRARA